MKIELGRCLLRERLAEAGMTVEELAQGMLYRTERIADFIDNKRVMSLKNAISISHIVGCQVDSLYELIPATAAGSRE
ncbi:helix-turn-helix domain-containing protein [Paenibacillus oenotherae]|uniref:Helix-turn-helix domain-containing protein n=1 Tax=Paenibacillus oenotherae TaxID=1435645 RepID=A0ABS7D6G2_9BACL|nr:helix-turn-helix domain-containing protein [Paenibacillus oenotherae]MBW7475456.1 helix-turn-helix domain-containing protein [Paenibacillus oenotherae]